MTQQEFQTQATRLINCFGKIAFNEERLRLVWLDVQFLDAEWFTAVVDRMIGECRQAPLLPEFRAEIAKERERLWRLENEKHAKEAARFMRGSFPAEDIRTICQGIIRRINGDLDDNGFTALQKALKNSTTGAGFGECGLCRDSGLVMPTNRESGTTFAFRCSCTKGRNDPRRFPIWSPAMREEYILEGEEGGSNETSQMQPVWPANVREFRRQVQEMPDA